MSKLMKMLPEQLTGGIQLDDEQSAEVDAQLKRTEAIIGSMTRQERERSQIIDASRKTRIARGSGSTISEVNQILRQYGEMKKMMAQMNKGGLFGGMARKMAGGLAGGLGNMLGGGNPMGMLGSGSAIDHSDESNGSNGSKSLRKKKRHKKRR